MRRAFFIFTILSLDLLPGYNHAGAAAQITAPRQYYLKPWGSNYRCFFYDIQRIIDRRTQPPTVTYWYYPRMHRCTGVRQDAVLTIHDLWGREWDGSYGVVYIKMARNGDLCLTNPGSGQLTWASCDINGPHRYHQMWTIHASASGAIRIQSEYLNRAFPQALCIEQTNQQDVELRPCTNTYNWMLVERRH